MSLLPVHRYALCTIENRSVTQPHSILYNAHNTPTDSKKETAIDISYSFLINVAAFVGVHRASHHGRTITYGFYYAYDYYYEPSPAVQESLHLPPRIQ